jgi:hypothetical protein
LQMQQADFGGYQQWPTVFISQKNLSKILSYLHF